MIDVANIKYRLVVMTEDKKQYNIKEFVENLGWEENDGELAVRISFTAKNDKTSAGLISSLAKPGCLVGIFASHGSTDEEVARGYITDWKPTLSGNKDKFDVICYDELYNLQESQELIYYSSGIGTKSAITKIFDDWQIPMDKYEGPDVTHGKLAYKTEMLSDVLLDILDDAKKKGGGSAMIRAAKGKVSVIEWGSNTTVYHFEADNTKQVSHKKSTSGMITRVKIIGQEDDDGRSSVEAVVNGLTKFGVRQKIYIRGKDDSVSDAQSAAQEIIDEKGQVKEDITVQAPDIPFIRKGDLVHMTVGTLKDYYYVKGIRHDADSGSMTMDLKKAVTEVVKNNQVTKKSYNVGDIVYFKGGTHYVSSWPGSKGYPAKAGKARIHLGPNCKGNGKAHPWSLIHIDSSSNVYGWVDEGTFE
nr:MAG: Prophage endopeptidase tail [Bacteriophage sp.]UWG81110.1 MAG: Prophage endopeptidase tail [Bacteriophage sp.]